MMKKYGKLILITSLLGGQAFSTELLLPDVLRKDQSFRPYVQAVFARSTDTKQTDSSQVFDTVASPTTFKSLTKDNFEEWLDIFVSHTGYVWLPVQYSTFKNQDINTLLSRYYPQTEPSESGLIFSANILYLAGKAMYEKTGNPQHLEQAASIGHDRAQYDMFRIDYKLSKYDEALNYIFSSASQGNGNALLMLSEIYMGFWHLKGVKPNNDTAKQLCHEAADRGNEEAIFTIQVSALTEGFFGDTINFQEGIKAAKRLADNKNTRAQKFIESIMHSSKEALREGNESITEDDIEFLKNFLNWAEE